MNAIYEGKITVSLSYIPKADENRMLATRDDNIDIYESFADTNKLVFLNEINPVGEIEPIDISINKTGGVLAYVDRTSQEEIVTYIKANGLILFPEDSSILFSNFVNLKEIEGLENVNTYYVKNMESMFNDCSSLVNLDLSTFDTSNLEVMYRMFYGMTQLENLNLSNFDTSNVKNMTEVFQDCSSLTNLDLSHFNTGKVTEMIGMFRNTNFTTLNLSGWDVSNIITSGPIFDNITSLTDLNVSNWTVSSETAQDFFHCESCSSINYINASDWYWKELTYRHEDFGFYLGENIGTLDISNWTFNYDGSVKIKIPNGTEENLIAKNWVFPEGADLSSMFNGCSSLTSLDLSHFNTNQVTDMSYMFNNCSNLTELNISNFDTSKVASTALMFANNQSLEHITYSDKFIYHNDIIVEYMFDSCPANKPSHSSWNNIFEDDI